MVKKVFFSLAVFSLVFLAAAAIKVKASGNVSGWLWGGSDNGTGSLTGISWISMNDTNTGIGSYGVNIPTGNGAVTGYAWSGGGNDGVGVGWIDFEPQNHCVVAPALPGPNQYQALSCTDPDGGSTGVSRVGDTLVGWARIVGIAEASVTGNSGGWTGWIKMSGTAQDGDAYGVTIESDGSFCKAGDPTTFEVAGDGLRHCAAWSGSEAAGGTELGFIDFSRASVGGAKTLKICEDSCDSGIKIADTSSVSSLTILETDPVKKLVACYNSDNDSNNSCNASTTDDTSTTVWTDNNNPNDAVSLIGANPASSISLSPNDAVDINKERVSATYNGETAAFDVTVTAVCSCKNCDISDKCVSKTFTGTNCPCSDSCAADSECASPSSSGPNWREVAP